MAEFKKPFTCEKIKSVLDFFKYYNLSDEICNEKIQCNDITLADFCKRHLKDNAIHRQNVLRLFDYIHNELDRDIMKRHYIDNQNWYDIAYELCYSERYVMKCHKRALEDIAKSIENLQEFEY